MEHLIKLRRWRKEDATPEAMWLEKTDVDELHLRAPGLDGWVSIADLTRILRAIAQEKEP